MEEEIHNMAEALEKASHNEPKIFKKLYRGIWADYLEDGEDLPVGGSIFSDELTTKIVLDFNSFKGQLDSFRSPQKLSELFVQNKPALIDWLSKVGSKIDPYIFFIANHIQIKVQALLDVDVKNPPTDLKRRTRFQNDMAKLSDLKGMAMCAEQASLGQHILQNVLEKGYSTSYVSGVEMQSKSANPMNHSFIVIKSPTSKTYIFDIARPISINHLPRILETDVPFTYDLFVNTDNRVVGATEVLKGGRLYFGVGNPMLDDEPQIIENV